MVANEKIAKPKEETPDTITQVRVNLSQMKDLEIFALDFAELASLSRVKLVHLAVDFFKSHYTSFSPLLNHDQTSEESQ